MFKLWIFWAVIVALFVLNRYDFIVFWVVGNFMGFCIGVEKVALKLRTPAIRLYNLLMGEASSWPTR